MTSTASLPTPIPPTARPRPYSAHWAIKDETGWPSCARCWTLLGDEYVDDDVVPLAFMPTRVAEDDIPEGNQWRLCLRCARDRWAIDGTQATPDPETAAVLDRVLSLDYPDTVLAYLQEAATAIEQHARDARTWYGAEPYEGHIRCGQMLGKLWAIVGRLARLRHAEYLSDDALAFLQSPEAERAVRDAVVRLLPSTKAAKTYARWRRENVRAMRASARRNRRAE